jgi:hypothetical protein
MTERASSRQPSLTHYPQARLLEHASPNDYTSIMPDDLYDHDVLAWSEHQAELLRRIARGERVNDVDWEHVVEEIEDVGRAELHALESYLEQILIHLLKLRGWPEIGACDHRRAEIVTFRAAAARRFAPSMRQRIDLAALYSGAVEATGRLRLSGQPPAAPPATCPVTLDELLRLSHDELEARFVAIPPGSP